MSEGYARFVVRKDEKGGLILGKLNGDLFKPNTVYQINEILGEFIIREVGESVITNPGENVKDSLHGAQLNWGWDASRIVEDGSHLYTREEYMKLCEVKRD